jgi:uncharacterized coiled-coil protein SlyX
MDIQTIDNAYAQLQQEAGQTSQKLQALASKLQAAAQSGDQNVREWMLDLREIALSVPTEENQVAALLQAMHGFAVSTLQQPQYAAPPPGYAPQPGYPTRAPGYPAQPPGYGYPQGGNPLSGFLNSGFGRAVETGLGFGLGDDLINKIF